MRTKLCYIKPEPQRKEKDEIIDRREVEYKQKINKATDGRKKDQREKPAAGRLGAGQATMEEQVEYTL